VSTEKTEAIVLRAVPWSETSLIVTLFTQDFGKISAIAKGARRPKSSFEHALDLLAHSSIVFIAKPGDVLDLLTEAKLIRRFRAGQKDLKSLYAGYLVAEVLLAMTEEGYPQHELFQLTEETLTALDRSDSAACSLLRFEWQVLRILGHMPNLENCVSCGETIDRSVRLSFGIEAGGILCNKCLPGNRHVLRLHPKTIEFLTAMLQDLWETLPFALTNQQIRREIRSLTNHYYSALRTRSFELHRYVDGLFR
jgi:DNA repair protein RecO (recombination protein O)